MQVRAKNTINKLPILILSDNAEAAYQIMQHADLATYTILATTSVDDVERVNPVVIISFDDTRSCLDLPPTTTSDTEFRNRPILISVSDNPSSDLFEISDQVIPTSYLPHIRQIITTQIARFQKAQLKEKQCAELETSNLHLSQDLAYANRTSTEIRLLKQAIVHSVAHELRTPMLQVKSAVALLNEEEHANRTIIELAMEATTRLEGGIRNVTLLNEMMNENSDAQSFSAVPIVQIVQAAVRNLGRSWEHKKEIERIEVISANTISNVLCDKQRLTIAIQLLLDNALKFSQEKVIVELTNNGKAVSISVRDYGIGISEDQRTHIFEAFYQIDGSSTRRFGGMGIGLAIVRLVLDQHCSTIKVKSKLGKGSTFAFDLLASEV